MLCLSYISYSPAINQSYDIEWDHKIHYHHKQMLTTSQDDLMVHTVENSHLKDDRTLTHTITFMDDTDDEFRVFHKLTYETINK